MPVLDGIDSTKLIRIEECNLKLTNSERQHIVGLTAHTN